LLTYLLRLKAAPWQLRHAAIGKQSDARLSHIYARIHGMARDPYAPSPPLPTPAAVAKVATAAAGAAALLASSP